jgi:hypothetical protein
MEEILPNEVKQLAGEILGSEEEDWWVRELTDTYKWLANDKIYWIIESDTDRSVLADLKPDNSCACLNCPDGLPIISNIIATNLGSDAIEKLGTDNFSLLLAEWHSDPRCYIATPRFFEKKQNEINDWLLGTEPDPQVLRDACVEPTLSRDPNGTWTLVYNVINRRGGIEQYTVQGTSGSFEIRSIDVKSLKEDGTFYYPDEL